MKMDNKLLKICLDKRKLHTFVHNNGHNMKNNYKIMHQIVFNERDYNSGNLIIMFMQGDKMTEVVSIPFLRTKVFCERLKSYLIDEFSLN